MKIHKQIKVICFMIIILATRLMGYASENKVETINPILVFPENLSIVILPFNFRDSSNKTNHNEAETIKDILIKKNDYNYLIYVPDVQELNQIMNNGFLKIDNKNRLTDLYPIDSFWKSKDIDYLIYGMETTNNDNKSIIEIYLYDVNNAICIIQKLFKFDENDYRTTMKMVTNKIISELKLKHMSRDSFN